MKRIHPLLRPGLAVFLILSALPTWAEEATVPLELGTPFSDHVVLQQGIPLPIWGTAPKGTEVTVGFAGQTRTATAGDDGAWRVVLDPLTADKLVSVNEAPEGKTLTAHANIGGKDITQTVKDVLIGEVWLCAGQSNMGGPLKMGRGLRARSRMRTIPR